jgi:hypothetical protein
MANKLSLPGCITRLKVMIGGSKLRSYYVTKSICMGAYNDSENVVKLRQLLDAKIFASQQSGLFGNENKYFFVFVISQF